VLEKLGFGAENATWRNCFLTGAQELRQDSIGHTDLNSAGMAPALTITQLFDAVGIRIVGSKAWDLAIRINWVFTDSGETYWMELSHGALIHYPTTAKHDAQLTLTLTKPDLLTMLATGSPDGVDMVGDASVLATLLSVTDNADPEFAVVTP
jgi:alkyl sulfatase BDS1-like metallo-beta-lactamase superfamily hydrolase